MLEELLKENELIGDIGEHAAFKQLHRQIALFDVGDIVSGVDNAEELIHQYQSTNLSMPKADEKIQAIIMLFPMRLNLNICACFPTMIGTCESGDATNPRNNQGASICAYSPASLQFSPNTKENRLGPCK